MATSIAAAWCAAAAAHGEVAFEYPPIDKPIVSATFSADFAALVAHRTVAGHEVNFARLIDVNTGRPPLDLSDELFGTAIWPEPPMVNMGPLETGWVSADIDPSFFPALASGEVGLWFTLTDTDDALFAIDALILTIQTKGGTVQNSYGTPIGNENDGFGLGIPDGGVLPAPLPYSIPFGATGMGYDEAVAGKGGYKVPEPSSLSLLAAIAIAFRWSRRRAGVRQAR